MSDTAQYIEDRRRVSDNSNIVLSVKLTMSGHPHQHQDDHFSYGCFGRTRRSPSHGPNPTVNSSSRRGLFGHGARTVLPPLHLPFRSSRSPAPEQSFAQNQQYAQQHIQPPRGEYNIDTFNQSGWPVNTNITSSSGQYSQDTRYAASTYPNVPSGQLDSRTLPPLAASQSQVYSHTGMPTQSMSTSSHGRTPSAFPAQYAYPAQTQPQAGYPYDPRVLAQPGAAMAYDPSTGAAIPRRPSMSVDRTVPSRMSVHAPSPYARMSTNVASPYEEEPAAEPAIKKKRKRADAEQLKVLNETYARTAFPSTEERIELAKKLGMSARSVQIWFQNKRQSMRQNSKAAAAQPPTTNEPGGSISPVSGVPTSASVAGASYALSPDPMSSVSMSGPGFQSQRMDPYGRPIPSPAPGSMPRPHSREDQYRRSSSRPY